MARKVNQVYLKEIIMVTKDNKVWHLSYDTLEKLKFTEINTIMKLIENNGDNNKSLYEDLIKNQSLRLPELSSYPKSAIFQSRSSIKDISQISNPWGS